MSLLPKIKYGEVETTRVVTDKYNNGDVTASKVVIRQRYLIKYGQIKKVPDLLTDLYSDSFKLEPRAYTEQLKSDKGGFFLITEYTQLELN